MIKKCFFLFSFLLICYVPSFLHATDCEFNFSSQEKNILKENYFYKKLHQENISLKKQFSFLKEEEPAKWDAQKWEEALSYISALIENASLKTKASSKTSSRLYDPKFTLNDFVLAKLLFLFQKKRSNLLPVNRYNASHKKHSSIRDDIQKKFEAIFKHLNNFLENASPSIDSSIKTPIASYLYLSYLSFFHQHPIPPSSLKIFLNFFFDLNKKSSKDFYDTSDHFPFISKVTEEVFFLGKATYPAITSRILSEFILDLEKHFPTPTLRSDISSIREILPIVFNEVKNQKIISFFIKQILSILETLPKAYQDPFEKLNLILFQQTLHIYRISVDSFVLETSLLQKLDQAISKCLKNIP